MIDAYKTTLANLLPFFFANDNIHYSRWLTIHLDDMLRLKDVHPDVEEEFQRGNFVFHKSEQVVSGIGIDQAHEHNNALIKGEGGAIGITENPSALLRWMVAGPEISHVIQEYEAASQVKQNVKSKHHEDTPAAQLRFHKEVKDLTCCIEAMGNPFMEEAQQLLTLDTKDVSDVSTLTEYHMKGEEKFKDFRENLHTFYEPIKRNNFKLFDAPKQSKKKIMKSTRSKTVRCSQTSSLLVRLGN